MCLLDLNTMLPWRVDPRPQHNAATSYPIHSCFWIWVEAMQELEEPFENAVPMFGVLVNTKLAG